jgi:2-C-methyl-D-erythritol 4-phosphate cytidylyltransferase
MKKVTAIVVAAGLGKRFGSSKQFALLRGKPLLDWSIESLAANPEIGAIILVLPGEKAKENLFHQHKKLRAVTAGGPRRQDSVRRGLEQVDPQTAGIVLIHDGVRPLLGQDLISRVISAARENGAAVPGVPVEDTIKEVDRGEVVRTLERGRLYRVQTPQGFTFPLLQKAFRQAAEGGYYGTDEASLVERTGHRVVVVAGDPRNVKVTTPADLRIVEALLGR